MKISLCASFMILWFNFAESDKKYNALIFDRMKKSLIEVSGDLSKDAKCGEWASACPAENQEDKNFNEKRSLYQNALFVRNIYHDKIQQNDLAVQVCDQPFKLSIAMFEEAPNKDFEFGYDIYLDSSKSEKFKVSDRGMYRSFTEIMKLTSSPIKVAKRFLEIPYQAMKSGKKKQNEDKNFMWIPLFKVRIMLRELRRIEYDIRKNNRQPMVQCQDYNLGKELFYNIDVNEFYTQEVQEKMFKSVKKPKESDETCKKSHICLEKWLLIPADQFQFGSTTLPSCSGATTVPIWSTTVKEVLKKVDDFLYALSRASDKPLRIIAGVNKRLKLSPKSWGLQKTVALKHKGVTIYAPRIIYKIVKLKMTYSCNLEDGCWYGIIIVIHNDPNFDNKSGMVCRDKSEELRWNEIKKYNTSSGKATQATSKYIYVCPIRSDTMEMVGLKYDGIPIRELSLKNFPYSRFQNLSDIKFIDIREKIQKEMRPTSPSRAESKKTEEVIIERPPISNAEKFF